MTKLSNKYKHVTKKQLMRAMTSDPTFLRRTTREQAVREVTTTSTVTTKSKLNLIVIAGTLSLFDRSETNGRV